jgi:diaminopimelate epimerase
VGADGLLLLLPSDKADFRMRVFNADGSEANACGNGIRCLVKYFVEAKGLESGKRGVTVETRLGVRDAWVETVGGETSIRIGMGRPELRASQVPVELTRLSCEILDIKCMSEIELPIAGRRLTLDLLSIGNPHAVHFVRSPVRDFPLEKVGREIQQRAVFPAGVNFEIARVVSHRSIEARVWEQGVGETLACGSGACAITVAAHLHGYADEKVEVILPGGSLHVEWRDGEEVFLSGPAEKVFVGDWPEASYWDAVSARHDAKGRPVRHDKNEVMS